MFVIIADTAARSHSVCWHFLLPVLRDPPQLSHCYLHCTLKREAVLNGCQVIDFLWGQELLPNSLVTDKEAHTIRVALGMVVSLAHDLKYFSEMTFVWGGLLLVVHVSTLPIPHPVSP